MTRLEPACGGTCRESIEDIAVGLTAYHMSDMNRLARLAADPRGETSHEEIYLAVASLYRIQGTGLNQRERDLMREILSRLTRDVEMAIRVALAQRLADDPTVPHDLVVLLADDAIEVARPLILHSPLLTEADALRLIARASTAHREAVAGRPGIGIAVTDALAALDDESVLLALARNVTAQISDGAYRTLMEKSRTFEQLQEPLARRPDLPPDIADSMCDWVSDVLKTYIITHYRVSAGVIGRALAAAAAQVNAKPPAPRAVPAGGIQSLVEKLAAAGQIKPSFLMRVLSQGQIDLFDAAFARLLGMDLTRFRARFYDGGLRSMALACRAAGIDKAAFATVFNLSRRAHGRTQVLTHEQLVEIAPVFVGFSRALALSAFNTD